MNFRFWRVVCGNFQKRKRRWVLNLRFFISFVFKACLSFLLLFLFSACLPPKARTYWNPSQRLNPKLPLDLALGNWAMTFPPMFPIVKCPALTLVSPRKPYWREVPRALADPAKISLSPWYPMGWKRKGGLALVWKGSAAFPIWTLKKSTEINWHPPMGTMGLHQDAWLLAFLSCLLAKVWVRC